jgi:hypothetical protein
MVDPLTLFLTVHREDRVRKGAEKLIKARTVYFKRSFDLLTFFILSRSFCTHIGRLALFALTLAQATPQTRLESFFKVLPSAPVEKRKVCAYVCVHMNRINQRLRDLNPTQADEKSKKSDTKKAKPGPAGKAAKPTGKGRPR